MTDDRAHGSPADRLGPLAAWAGTWRGRGHGDFPTIEPFDFVEEVELRPGPGKPFLAYAQRTRHALDDRPLHAETGWLRALGPGDAGFAVEWVVAQPTGITEIAAAVLEDGVIDVTCRPGLTPSAVRVSQVRRRFVLDGDSLSYDLWMATADVTELTHHLHVALRRS